MKETFFSWRAFFIASLPVPTIAGLLLTTTPGQAGVLRSFFFGFLIALSMTLSATLFLLLPSLRLLAATSRPTGPRVALLGALLGLGCYLPWSWLAYTSSGPDSGPPEGTYLDYLIRSGFDETIPVLAVSGLITACAYWYAIPGRRGRNPCRGAD